MALGPRPGCICSGVRKLHQCSARIDCTTRTGAPKPHSPIHLPLHDPATHVYVAVWHDDPLACPDSTPDRLRPRWPGYGREDRDCRSSSPSRPQRSSGIAMRRDRPRLPCEGRGRQISGVRPDIHCPPSLGQLLPIMPIGLRCCACFNEIFFRDADERARGPRAARNVRT